jgi:hypothetical protein
VHGSTLHQQIQVVFYSLFGVISDEIWAMIKTTALYQLPQYKILELVVKSEPISGSENYDPISIPENSNPVMAEEKTHFRAWEQQSSRAPIQNMDVDVNVDEDNEEEKWHLDAEENEIEDAMDVEEIVKE